MTTKTTTDVAAPDASAKTLTLEDVLELTGAASAEELVERLTAVPPVEFRCAAEECSHRPEWLMREAALNFAVQAHQNDRSLQPGAIVMTAKAFADFLQAPSKLEPTSQQAA